jgi:hypothetical protein
MTTIETAKGTEKTFGMCIANGGASTLQSMRKTAGKLGVSLSTVQRVKMENMTCFGAMDH